jgi:hypothetical protein
MPHSGLPQTRRPPWINTTNLKMREHKTIHYLPWLPPRRGPQALRPVLRHTEFRRGSQTKFRMNTSQSLKAEWRSVWVSSRPSTRKQQQGVGGGGRKVAHAFQVLRITAPSTDANYQDPAQFSLTLFNETTFTYNFFTDKDAVQQYTKQYTHTNKITSTQQDTRHSRIVCE